MRQILALAFVSLLSTIPTASGQTGAPPPHDRAIDIHAHTFNLRYLPTEGILCSFCVPPGLARSLAEMLEEMVVTDDRPSKVLTFEAVKQILQKDPHNRSVGPWLDLLRARLRETAQERQLQRKQKSLVKYVDERLEREAVATTAALPMEEGAFESGGEGEEEAPILSDYLFDSSRTGEDSGAAPMSVGGASPAFARRETLALFDPIDLVIAILKKGLKDKTPAAKFAGFFTILLLNEDDLMRLMSWNYESVDLFVSQMMDMEVAYRDPPVLPFEKQTERMKELAARHRGVIWFGAYDPLRPDGLVNVERALQRGAVGIKFYPPSGYRPIENRIPGPSGTHRGACRFLARRELRKQRESRYGALLAQAGGDPMKAGRLLDQRIGRFLDLARKERFAILSHQTPEGFESADGYGSMMAHPCLWGEVLKKRPDLILILGHAGGGEAWFGDQAAWNKRMAHPLDPDRQVFSFDRQAYNLCISFPNVYCDMGYSMEVLDPQKRPRFEARLKSLVPKPLSKEKIPDDFDFCEARDVGQPRYDLREKILYGSDWMMPEATFVGKEYFKAFEQVFDGELKPYARLFFRGNAERLLCGVKNPPVQLDCGRRASAPPSTP